MLLLAQRKQVERQRREELARPLVRHDEQLPGPRDMRRGERGELPLGRSDSSVPRRADGGERPFQRRLDAAVQPLDAVRREKHRAGLSRRDRDPGVLEPVQDLLPLPLGALRVRLDEHERRAERERLAQTHPRLDPSRLCGRRDRAEQWFCPFCRSESRRAQSDARTAPQRRPQLEPGDSEAGDHGNVCSTRTDVPLQAFFQPSEGFPVTLKP